MGRTRGRIVGLGRTVIAALCLAAPAPALALKAPSNFKGAVQSASSILWSWKNNDISATGYRVMSGTVSVSGGLAPNASFWSQGGLQANTAYGAYYVQGFNAKSTVNSNSYGPLYTLAAVPSWQAASESSTTISLKWGGNPAYTVYDLERSSGGGAYVTISSAAVSSFLDADLSPSTSYSYRVRAYNAAGYATSYSVALTTATLPPPPAAPSGFGGWALGTGSLRWSWSDNSGSESGYRVLSGTVSLSGDLPANTTTWEQAGLSADVVYGPYAVEAFNAGGVADSTAASRATLAAVPGSLSVARVSSTTAALAWTANGNPAGAVYELDRDGARITTTTALSFLDSGLAPLSAHAYDARAFNADSLATAFTASVSTTTLPPDPPAAPQGFTGLALSSAAISWTWTDASYNEAGFRVLSGTSNVSGDLPSGATQWLQTGLAPNAAYGAYVVEAFNAGGAADSGPAAALTDAALPAALSFVAVSSQALTLSWSANGNPGGTLYEVQRDGVSLATTTALSLLDDGLAPLATYYYAVQAANAAGAPTGFTAAVSTVTLPPDIPTAPAAFAGTAQGATAILWTWLDRSDDETGFRVLGGTYAVSPDLPADTTYWLQTGLSTAALYGLYTAEAFNAGGSTQSAAAYRNTLAAAPSRPSVTSVSSTTVSLTWTAPDDPAGLVFELTRDGTRVYKGTALTYTDSGLTPLTAHAYAARAYNGDGLASAYGASTTTATGPPDGPSPPAAFAGAAVGTSSLTWTWAAASGAAGYRVLSGTTNVSGDLSAAALAWTQTGLSPAVSYGPYAVEAFNAGGAADSPPSSRATLAAPPAALAASASSTTVTLSWSSGGDPAGTPYTVLRDAVAVGVTTTTSFVDAGLPPSSSYLYAVSAANPDGVAAVSTSTLPAATSGADLPAAPTGFSGAALSPSAILWTWSDNASNETGYRVARGTVNVSGDLPADTTFWLQTGLSTNTQYGAYSAAAFNASGQTLSASDARFTLAAAPTTLTVTAVSSSTVDLAWSANGNPDGTVYEIDDSAGGAFTIAATAAQDDGLDPLSLYTYQALAYNGDGIASAYSDSVTTETLAADPAGAPTGFAGTALGVSSITWSWSASTGAVGYDVFDSSGNDLSGFLDAQTTSWLETGLSTNTVSGPYVVAALNDSGEADAPPASAATLAAAPSGLSVVSVLAKSVTLSWSSDDPAGTVYQLQRDGLPVSTTTALDYTDLGLAPQSTYTWRVRAANFDGLWTDFTATATTVTAPPGQAHLAVTGLAPGLRVFGNALTLAASGATGSCPAKKVAFQIRPSGSLLWSDVPGTAARPNPVTAAPFYTFWDASSAAPGSYELRAVAVDCEGVSDGWPAVTTVVVDPASPQRQDRWLGGGQTEVVQTVWSSSDNVIAAGAWGAAQVVTVRLSSASLSASTAALTLGLDTSPGIPRWGQAGAAVSPSLSEPFRPGGLSLSLGYTDSNGDGLIDGTTLKLDEAAIMSYDAPTNTWQRRFASSVDPSAPAVVGAPGSLGTFALLAPQASANLAYARVYPYPYRPNAGNPDLGAPYNPGDPNSGIIFDNLTSDAEVRVYTLNGRLVATLASANAQGRLQWDARNSDGQDVASGAYIAVISGAGAKNATRKILIIR